MKKLLYISIGLLLLLGAFLAGTWFNQSAVNSEAVGGGERRILHYVDPMNPGNISSEPGIAPCGMPMEPVYADEQQGGSGDILDAALAATPGLVRVDAARQQLIGVQTTAVQRVRERHTLRALGRVAADENQVYAIYSATDGWMGKVHDSTTGDLVTKDQLLAQIKVFDYDFFTWQQRYLTEIGNVGMRPVYVTPPSIAAKADERMKTSNRPMPSSPSAREQVWYKDPTTMMLERREHLQNRAPSKAIPPDATSYGDSGATPEQEGDGPSTQPPGMSMGHDHHQMGDGTASAGDSQEQMMRHKMAPAGDKSHRTPVRLGQSNLHESNEHRLGFIREDDILYATKGRLELLDLGVGETQLAELARTGVYVTRIDLRSPVDGLVLSRAVSPMQRIERGMECFRIADLSTVWVEADLYDMENLFVRPGMSALISFPGQERFYKAQVTAVPPRFDGPTRTLKVRLELDNPEYLFRPEMFVDVQLQLDLPESLTVPASAVIDDGSRSVVYVEEAEGVFAPRVIEVGYRFGDRVQVTGGLAEGEQIVVSGNFLIDSESRMRLAAHRLMNGGAVREKMVEDQQLPQPQPSRAMAMTPATRQQHHDPQKAVDPVCKMKVDMAEAEARGLMVAAGEGQEQQNYYFCSVDCLEQFSRKPGSFIKQMTAPPAMHGDAGHSGHNHD